MFLFLGRVSIFHYSERRYQSRGSPPMCGSEGSGRVERKMADMDLPEATEGGNALSCKGLGWEHHGVRSSSDVLPTPLLKDGKKRAVAVAIDLALDDNNKVSHGRFTALLLSSLQFICMGERPSRIMTCWKISPMILHLRYPCARNLPRCFDIRRRGYV